MESSPKIENPKIFISYSWSSPEHEEWVLELSKKLVSDGVDVIIDKWNLKEGQDLYHFMEQMVRSEDIFKVLIILDKAYKEKADARTGGVGTETQIISPEIYSNVSQEKFIPIIAQLNKNGKPYIPNFLKSRVYINLAETESYEGEYEKLLRNLYQRPSQRKPKLGKAPSYLFEDEENTTNLALINKKLEVTFERHKSHVPFQLNEFTEQLISALEKYRISYNHNEEEFDHAFMNSLNEMIGIRDEVVKFFELYCYHNINDILILTGFFEKLLPLTKAPEGVNSYTKLDFQNFSFFIKEVLYYLIAVMLRYQKYTELGDFLFNDFLFYSRFHTDIQNQKFDLFYSHISVLDDLHKKLSNSNLLSVTGDLILKRTHRNYKSSMLVEADLLCYYMSKIVGCRGWFPILYIYQDKAKFDTLRKLKSKRHFDKVKSLFKVENIEQLKKLFSSMKFEDRGYSMFFEHIPPITKFIDTEQIGSLT